MSEDIDLNAVASASMSESVPQETVTAETQTAVAPSESIATQTSKVEKPVTQVSNPATVPQQQKLSRRQAAAKEAADYRAKAEQRDQENQRRIENYERQIKELEPIKPFLSDIQKAMLAKKQQEDAQRLQQLTPEQRTQEMIQQAILPYQQQVQQAELTQFANQSLQQIKTMAGSEEVYKEVSPVMSNILNNIFAVDPDASDKLARNPEFLFRIARDYVNEQKKATETVQQQQTQVENQRSKAEIAKFNGGISKPNRFAKAPTKPGRELAKNNAFDYIKELTGQK